jgi:nitrogen-specific signal transduction histidine kinase/CheY-like chemotaxis protein
MRRATISAHPEGVLILDQEICGDSVPRVQAQKMETVGRLVSGVAHDFANLITLIAGYSDMLLSRIGEKDPLRSELEEIRKAANRGSRLTAQLLGFTRGDSVHPRPLDLNSLVTDVQRMLRPIIGEHLEMHVSLGPATGKVVADPGQMEQVLMNLILNARDAMPGGGRIHIETATAVMADGEAEGHGVKPGPYALLSITDTGHGIAPDAMERIFQPFFTTKEKGKGTGIGLSTVLTIVKESGGDIWVRSLPGQGATFTLCLPLVKQYAAEAKEPAATLRSAPSGTETVLLVEDEDGVRRLLAHVLQRRGYRVLEACDGEDALRIFEERPGQIQLVLTDMVMPKVGGRELGEKLRRANPGLPIIYMSGYTDDVLVRTGALGPGMLFLEKPLRPEVLAAKVRETLDSSLRPFNPA